MEMFLGGDLNALVDIQDSEIAHLHSPTTSLDGVCLEFRLQDCNSLLHPSGGFTFGDHYGKFNIKANEFYTSGWNLNPNFLS